MKVRTSRFWFSIALAALSSCTAKTARPPATHSTTPTTQRPSASATPSPTPTPVCTAATPSLLHTAAPPAGLGIWLTLDRTTVAQGASIMATLHAHNCTSTPVDLTHPTTCPTGGVGLYQDNAYAGGQAPAFCGQTVTPDAVAAGATKTWTFTIDTFGEPNSSGQRQPVDPGRYTAAAGISVRDGVWFAPPVPVTVVEG